MTTAAPVHTHLQARLQAHLGPNLAVVCSGVEGDPQSLFLEERAAIIQAIPRRQREFAAGRLAARIAMQQLGCCISPVPSNPDRSPCWPEGLVGTISHSSTVCVVVLGRKEHWRSIGIDIEPNNGIETSLWNIICSPTELEWVNAKDAKERAFLVSRIFTAKEAFYKSRDPEQQANLEFQACDTSWGSIDSELHTFSIFADLPNYTLQSGLCLINYNSIISWVVEKEDNLSTARRR